jgi:hypothetical protein
MPHTLKVTTQKKLADKKSELSQKKITFAAKYTSQKWD